MPLSAPAQHWRNATQAQWTERSRARKDGGAHQALEAMGGLQDADAEVRENSVLAIGFGGPKAVGEPSSLLRDPEAKVRFNAARAIGKEGPEAVLQAVAELKALLHDKDGKVRMVAARAIAKGGPEAVLQAVAELKALLQDTEARLREMAAVTIARSGPEAVLQAVAELKALLQDKEARVRAGATWAIELGGRKSVLQAVRELKALLHEKAARVRYQATLAIEKGGPEAVFQATVELKALLQDKEGVKQHVPGGAAWAIAKGGPKVVLQAVSELKALLQDKEAKNRWNAAYALGQGGPEAALQAVDELTALLDDEHETVRFFAASAIEQGGPKAVLQAMDKLKTLLHDPIVTVRVQAAKAIGNGGSEAVRWALDDLVSMLSNANALIREAAASSLQHGDAEVIKHAVASILPSLVPSRVVPSPGAFKNATETLEMMGLAAIEDCVPHLLKVLREEDVGVTSEAHFATLQQILGAAARPLRRFFFSRPGNLHADMFRDLKRAESKLTYVTTTWPQWKNADAARDVQDAIDAFNAVAEDQCANLFEAQVGRAVPVKWSAVQNPQGYMVHRASRGLNSHRCPNKGACPREGLNVTVATASSDVTTTQPQSEGACPLSSMTGTGTRCEEGYDSHVAGCAGCLQGWGRSLTDAFECKQCASMRRQWAVGLAQTTALLALSLRSALNAGAAGQAAAFTNDVLKIGLSYSASSTVIISSLGSSEAYRSFTSATKERLGLVSGATQSGEAVGASSPDCLLGRMLSLNELLVMSLVNPVIVVSAAALVLGIICIFRRWQGQESSFVKDMMTLVLVGGNQYLPTVAAACVVAVPCFHTQTEESGGKSLMAYSIDQSCDNRGMHIALRAPVLLMVFAAGPFLWRWLIQTRAAEDDNQFLRFLTASYRPKNQSWEANRLAKNILMKCAVAAAPGSYHPGLQLILVLCLMFSFTAWHLRSYPYKFDLLNSVEAISLCVLDLCMMISSLVVSESWPMTRAFAGSLTLAAHGILAINAFGLASLFLWAKARLHNDHDLLKT